jgi:ABC-2 type transport system ATP-binding protein
MSAPRLELEAVSRRHRWRGPWVLDEVSLAVDAGEAVQVGGTNGSGKSTLLRVAAGLQPANRGRVRTTGTRRYVPEHTPAPPALTVRQYLHHQARLQEVPAAGQARWVDDTVERHRLGPALERRLGHLSKGWGQRCLLAQALAGRPDLVLLDEPWTGVDDASRHHLVAVVAELVAGGTAVVLTSHEHVELPALRRLRLIRGRLTDADRVGGGGGDAVVTRVVRRVSLVARPGAPPLAAGFAATTGVVAVDIEGAQVELVVDADATGDAVLVALLQRGWTIEHLATGEAP